jgi:hypothetical protein
MINPYQNLPPGVTIFDLEPEPEEPCECRDCGKRIPNGERKCMACWLEECGCDEKK